jgi:PleD family two-component response regulator
MRTPWRAANLLVKLLCQPYSRIVSESDSGVIVVADDDADILDLVSLTLERAGYVVHRARDGEEALQLVRR